jgi:hypothetical protein
MVDPDSKIADIDDIARWVYQPAGNLVIAQPEKCAGRRIGNDAESRTIRDELTAEVKDGPVFTWVGANDHFRWTIKHALRKTATGRRLRLRTVFPEEL